MKRAILLIADVLCTVACFAANAPAVDARAREQRIDQDWKFAAGDRPSASSPRYDDAAWRTVDLPHDWSIEGTIGQKNPTGAPGGYFPAGAGWYRKRLGVPSAWQGKRVSIYFEGVYGISEVFINGVSLGVHPYGYTPFSYDLTSHLQFNDDNILAVRVDNSQQINCRWYSGSGIYRHVRLVATSPLHIDQWGVCISAEDVHREKAIVRVKTFVKNETAETQSFVLSTVLTDESSAGAGKSDVKVTLPGNSERLVEQSMAVARPKLWTPGSPSLYRAQIRLAAGKRTIDTYRTAFGIRSLHFSAEGGFQLNGEPMKIDGGCVHHDNGCLGSAAYDRAEERRVELLKAAGFNTVRTSHNPPSEAFLEACDRLGLMVIDEAFDGWREPKNPNDYALFFDAWSQRDLESMVKRDWNHPSIIMWSTGNEIMERKKPEAVETARRLASRVRALDPTRPVTSAMTTWDDEWNMFDPLMAAHDVAGYNYQIHRAAADHERVPSRIILQTESFPKDAFSNWKMVQGHPYIIGDVVWTALDYLGESGIGRYYYPGEPKGESWEVDLYPWHGAYCGDIDMTGWRKPISHYRAILWNSTEKLYMAVREPNPDSGEIKTTMWAVWPAWASWTWPGREGKGMQVDVYSKYPAVRLFLNGRLLEERPTTVEQEFKTTFTLPYAPGVLRAVGVQGGNEVDSTILATAGRPARIRLNADRTKISAGGQDLSFVTVEITDENGIVQPNAEDRLVFALEGPGSIVGVDSGNPKDPSPYVASVRRAWHGRALVVVKSARSAGEIRLTARSEGLPESALVIHTSRP